MAGEVSQQAKIPIHEGCDPRVAAAINRFARKLDRSKSRCYSIYTLMSETIDGAWRDYIASLPDDYAGKALCESQILSVMAEQIGLFSLHSTFTFIVGAVGKCHATASSQNNGLKDALHATSKASLQPIHGKFLATVSSLRELVSVAELKKPQRISAGRLNARRLKPHCELCGDPSELATAINGKTWPYDNPNGRANLSSRYCSSHRPRNHDGSWNPAYRRALRSKAKFDSEIVRVEHHTSNLRSIDAAKRKGIEDPFLWALSRTLKLYLFEDERCRNVARFLVDSRIDIRKKQMIVLLVAGFSQSDIARKLKISRQAVSKAVSSESFKKVFRMYRSGVWPHHQSAPLDLPHVDGYIASTSA
jgi:Homeodomain-like domain